MAMTPKSRSMWSRMVDFVMGRCPEGETRLESLGHCGPCLDNLPSLAANSARAAESEHPKRSRPATRGEHAS
jgi:hypothetical protein